RWPRPSLPRPPGRIPSPRIRHWSPHALVIPLPIRFSSFAIRRSMERAMPATQDSWQPPACCSLPAPTPQRAGRARIVPIARLLLDAGANPTDGESVFHAAEHFHEEALELLLRAGADL